LNEDVESLVNLISSSDGAFIDMQAIIFRFTYDAICQIAFGIRPRTLENGADPILKAFDR